MTKFVFAPALWVPEKGNLELPYFRIEDADGAEWLRLPKPFNIAEDDVRERGRQVVELLNKAGTLDVNVEAESFEKLLEHVGHKIRLDWHGYNGETYMTDIVCVPCQQSLFAFSRPWQTRTSQTRLVEMYYGDAETKAWDTLEIEIPDDTPANRLEAVAKETMSRELRRRNIQAAFWGIHHVNELPDEIELDGEDEND